MVYAIDFIELLFAHTADPRPQSWEEALANSVVFAVTFAMVFFLSFPVLEPLLRDGAEERSRKEALLAILAVVGLTLGMGWWLVRSSWGEAMSQESTREEEDHSHIPRAGGQVAMWADFHAEVTRIESGVVLVFLRDSYNRNIAARYFEAEVSPFREGAEDNFQSTYPSLNGTCRFLRLGREHRAYRVRVSTPGWTTTLRLRFDGSELESGSGVWCVPSSRGGSEN